MVRSLEKQLEESERLRKASELDRTQTPAEDDRLLLNSIAKTKINVVSEEQYRALHDELEEKDKEMLTLKKKLEELSKYSQIARKLRDDMDLMKEKVQHAEALEEKLARAQRKADAVDELKQRNTASVLRFCASF